MDGNRGYDAKHYFLNVRYNPDTDRLGGAATITARATKNLSRFNFDFHGMHVASIKVNGDPAAWRRDGDELIITPRHGLPKGDAFVVVVRYSGVPETINDTFGQSGFIHTDDGALVVGQPHVAATWFPANDHPSDKAAYTFHVTVPKGLEAVANGTLQDRHSSREWTTWTWKATEPMASYLATASVGEFDLNSYRQGGIRYWDAIDPDLLAPVAVPRTGSQLAISHRGEQSYKRLINTISVPNGGAKLSFWVKRDTEPNWDFAFVEAHTLGKGDWTTLRDLNGHTSTDRLLLPVLARPASVPGALPVGQRDPRCSPTGKTGKWWAVSGASDGWEQWEVDLSRFAGRDARVSITTRATTPPAPWCLRRRHRRFHRRWHDLVRRRRQHVRRLGRPRRPGKQQGQPQRLDRGHVGRRPSAARPGGARVIRTPGRDHRVPGGRLRSLPIFGCGGDRG